MKTLPLLCIAISVLCPCAHAQVEMPAIFGDHMVLQQQQTLPIWGTATPGESVQVTLASKHASTKADAAGKWRVELPSFPATSKATRLTVKASNTLIFSDVLIGDVWLASGQSNMGFGIGTDHDGPTAVANSSNPLIRIFVVPERPTVEPVDDVVPTGPFTGRWMLCSPETLTYGWNGQAPLTSKPGFSAVAYYFAAEIQKFTGKPVGVIGSYWGGTGAESWTSLSALAADPLLEHWAVKHRKTLADYNDAMQSLPDAMKKFTAADKEWTQVSSPANDRALADWKDKAKAAEAAGEPDPPRPRAIPRPSRPDPTGGSREPSDLYNGMISPIVSYAIKGAIWYQGEANSTAALAPEYKTLFPTMITDWRTRWGQGDFPFLFVQLPNYHDQWGMLREAQARTLKLPHTGMAVTIDLGIFDNLHPPYKQMVGHRLALVAEDMVYGASVPDTGPVFRSMDKLDGSIRLSFDHTAGGLVIGSTPLRGPGIEPAPTSALQAFSIAGADMNWVPADARIVGDSVIVSSPAVEHPEAVRYGWAPAPQPNLYNRDGFPAAPFRTDNLPR